MSGRKSNLRQFQIISAASMSVNITSSVTNIQMVDNIGIQLNFTGTPTGTFAAQVSADYAQDEFGNVTNAGNWISLSLSPAPVAAGSASTIYLDLNQLSAPWIRTTYTSTATGVQTIAPVADVAGSLAGKYFLLSDEQGNNYAIWFKVSSVGSAPTVAGYTNVEQDISTGDTAATIGAALATTIAALNATASFTTSGTTTVIVTNKVAGPFTPAGAGTSGFTVAITAGGGTLNAYVTGKMI